MELERMSINSWIRVKLSDKGYQIMANYYNFLMGVIPDFKTRDTDFYKKSVEEDGTTRFQMWHFTSIFRGELDGVTTDGMIYFESSKK